MPYIFIKASTDLRVPLILFKYGTLDNSLSHFSLVISFKGVLPDACCNPFKYGINSSESNPSNNSHWKLLAYKGSNSGGTALIQS